MFVFVMIFSLTGTTWAHFSYYAVVGHSMNPELQDGDVIEIVSEEYQDGDMVVAIKKDGTKIVKRLMGDKLVSVGDGTSYSVDEVTILGAAKYTPMSLEELEAYGFRWETVLAEGEHIVQVAGGHSHSLALTNTGVVYAWGENVFGQLGVGLSEVDYMPTPVKVWDGDMENEGVDAIAAGALFSIALKDGKVYGWGWNIFGELGVGDYYNKNVPTIITGALGSKTVKAIAAGQNHSLALTTDGKVYSWGQNNYGQLGTSGNDRSYPQEINGGALGNNNVSAIAAGYYHSLALKEGKVYSWGYNIAGQLGDGNRTGENPNPTPRKIDKLVSAEFPGITTITKQPAADPVVQGTSLKLTVEANVSDGGTLSYQWYRNTTSSNIGGTLVGEGSEFPVPTNEPGTFYYYVEVTNTNHNVLLSQTAKAKSHPVAVTVLPRNAAEPVITSQPSGATVVEGDPSPELTVEAEVSDGGTLSYQWYKNTANDNTGGTPIPQATDKSYSPPTDQAGTAYYYVVVTNTNNQATGNKTASVTSNTAEVTVYLPSGGGGGSPDLPENQFIIKPESGQDIDFEGIQLRFPAGVWHHNFTITINKENLLPKEQQPKEGKMVSAVYEIIKDHKEELLKEFAVTIPFQLEEEDKYEVDLYVYSEEKAEWTPLEELAIDWNEKTVSGKTKETGKFAVIAKEKRLDEVYFKDIAGHWAEKEIQALTAKGLIKGYPDETFKPEQPITRAEFVAMVVRALGLEMEGEKTFSDTANHWAKDVVSTAYEHGIITGYNAMTFGPDDPITREQMAAIMVNAFRLQQKEKGKQFADQEQISLWSKGAVEIAASHGIFGGYQDGTFKPQNRASRAEATAVMARALQFEK